MPWEKLAAAAAAAAVEEENMMGWRRNGGCEYGRSSVGVDYNYDGDIDHKIGCDKKARNSETCP